MSLREADLKDLVDNIFEIDSYASKMGDDRNIVTLSFSVADKAPAEDLANFLEKGYNFILDADVTSGEQNDGRYKVFVELERERSVHDNINEILDGVGKLASVDKFKYRYYKSFKSTEATLENMIAEVPSDPDSYNTIANESNMNNFKNFFNRSYVESIEMLEDIITIRKKYAEPLQFKIVDFGNTINTVKQIAETLDVMNSFPEILFLTKYLGDYNISKYGDKLVFENQGKALVLKRI
jgi:hypothetical protein